MPRTGCAGRRIGPRRRAGSTTQHAGDTGIKRVFNLLRANPVDVRINAASGNDVAFTGDNFGARTNDDINTGLDIRVPGLTNGGNAAIPNADIGLDDAGIIKDQRVGDHGINRTIRTGDL